MLALADQTLMRGVEADRTATVAKALAHPARVRIIAFLRSRPGRISNDIVDEVGLAQPTVSEHLRILMASGPVAGTIEHPRIRHALDPFAPVPLRGSSTRSLQGRPKARSSPATRPKAASPLPSRRRATMDFR